MLIAERTGKPLEFFLEDELPVFGAGIDFIEIEQLLASEDFERVKELTAHHLAVRLSRADTSRLRFLKGQAMHWLRIERYWGEGMQSEQEFPEQGAQFLPMMCQQCEAAPCEIVCPVGATHHTPDGLNSQVYNRCVGSRYCSANCPYKVRYFNWYNYPESAWPSPLEQQLNPDVTVRSKGVMEKCTFCVQRLNEAKSKARTEDRTVRDGEVLTACAQACPTSAIHFGNLADSSSQVAKMWKAQQVELSATPQEKEDESLRGYRVLEDLRTYPSVVYLERLRSSEV